MAYRKGLVLSLGMLNVIVSLDGAVGKDDSLTTVCCGGPTPHAPTPIRQERQCSHCGTVSYADLKKAREIGSGQFQVVDQQEVATVKDQTLGATKKMLQLTVHPATEVQAATLQGEGGVYYLEPEGPAQIGAYSLLLDALQRHPEKAIVTRWTPTSSVGTYQLKAFNGVLVLEKRCDPEQVKAAPAVPVIEPDAGLQAQMDMVIEAMEKPFDAALYRNEYATALEALLASKDTVEGEHAERVKSDGKTVATAGVVDLSATLAAMLGGAPAAAPTAAPKKRATAKRKTA